MWYGQTAISAVAPLVWVMDCAPPPPSCVHAAVSCRTAD